MPLIDTFTGTNGTELTAHTSDSGHSWTRVSGDGTTNKFEINGNRLMPTGGTGAEYYASWLPANADYDVEAVLVYLTDQPFYMEFAGRVSTDGQNKYAVAIDDFSDTMYLTKKVAGTDTTLGSAVALNRSGDTIKLEMRGTALKVYRNGSQIISATDSSLSTAGRVWVGKFGGPGATDGWMFDSITGTDAGAAPTIVSALQTLGPSYAAHRAASI